MKTALFIGAAAVALAASAPAMAQTAGSIGANYVWSEIDTPLGDADTDSYGVDGQVAFQTSTPWTVTIDGAVQHSDDADVTTASGSLHGTRMFGSDVRAGAFVGLADADGETLWAIGGEVQKYMANVTLSGQLAYGQADDADLDLWGARGEARYYVNPNLRLNAGLGYTKVDAGAGGDTDAWSYGLGGEYQFNASPISVYGGWERVDFNDFDIDVDSVTVGVRYTFGGDLQSRERAGAALGSALSAFGAALAL